MSGMQINSTMLALIEDFLKINPLGKDEIVRVKGLGEKYISLATLEIKEDFKPLFDFKINGVKYTLYIRASN